MSAGLIIANLELRLGAFSLGPLSLELANGEYLVLLGPSGCGKTSLLKAICGLQPVRAGTIHLGGETVTQLPPERRRIGYVAQTSELFPHLSVAENIAFGMRYRHLARSERESLFARLVELLELEPLLQRRTPHLSGGESRRVALARSLATGPRLLLLDEPLSMLDPNARADMLRSIGRLHREMDTPAIHVTHDREEAWTMAGRCAVMQAGRIEQAGPVAEIFRAPRTRFVAEFVGGGNVFPATFAPAADGAVAVLAGGLRVPVRGELGPRHRQVLIRPETLSLTGGIPGCEIRGVVAQATPRGAYAELRVTTTCLGTLLAYLPAGVPLPSAGAPIILHLVEPGLPLEDSPQ